MSGMNDGQAIVSAYCADVSCDAPLFLVRRAQDGSKISAHEWNGSSRRKVSA
jgi:hypothetical protein